VEDQQEFSLRSKKKKYYFTLFTLITTYIYQTKRDNNNTPHERTSKFYIAGLGHLERPHAFSLSENNRGHEKTQHIDLTKNNLGVRGGANLARKLPPPLPARSPPPLLR
jgi:hypothetical protein